MYPISDLTTFCRKTSGDVPPKLVGASTTVVGSKLYLYGGRLVAERRMVSDIYMFDLETFNWERIPQASESDLPQTRYFHSADAWNNHLIIFGGMTLQPDSANPDELHVLNDVRFFNLSTRRWLAAPPGPSPDSMVPKRRYAHLSSVAANRLFIVGGQDLSNIWLDDIHVFDLRKQTWIHRRDYPRHCGTYRSVAVSANNIVRFPQDEIRPGESTSKLGPSGARFSKYPSNTKDRTPPESLVHLPYSTTPTDDHPSDIYLFSNYNFTNVQRELEVFKPSGDSDFTISDQSSAMTGNSFPPGLRFPAGAILGTHFIVAGTYLTQSYQAFSIWALDLITMSWSRIDPGSALSSGSWFRSCVWPEANKFLVFGNSHGNLTADYNRRLLSWDHVACIDLEAFGIYQHPPLFSSIENQELGLAALEEKVMADFEIICDDNRKISCSRRVLEERWPWFKQQRELFLQTASRAVDTLPSSSHDVPMPDIPSVSKEPRPDPRLSPRSFHLSESYPVSLAFTQYFYTRSLVTPLQHAPAVLSQLLLLSNTYNLSHLQTLVKHAMHRALTYATSVGIYGVATLCNCRSLQIRALRVVMAYSQKRPPGRSSRDKDGSNEGRSGGTGGGSGGGSDTSGAARPRGMSDASFIHRVTNEAHQGGGLVRGYSSSDSARDADLDRSSFDDLVVSFPPTPTSISFQQQISLRSPGFDELSSSTYLAPLSPSLSTQSSNEAVRSSYSGKKRSPIPSPASSFIDISPNSPISQPASAISHRYSLLPVGESSLVRKRLGDRQQSLPSNLRAPRTPDSLNRAVSVISTNTDQDLCAIAEIMSPMITGFTEQDKHEDRIAVLAEVPTPVSVEQPPLNEDPETDPGELCSQTSSSYPAFHLPSPGTIAAYRDSDTPSLASSSSSFSSGIAPSQPSLQNLHSPPDTPGTSYLSNNSLSIIEEQDFDHQYSSSTNSISFASPESDGFPALKPFTVTLEPFGQSGMSPTDTVTDHTHKHSVSSSTGSSASLSLSSKSRHSKVPAFSRLFSSSLKHSRSSEKGKEVELDSSKMPPSNEKQWKGLWDQSSSSSSTKSEEKKRKKESAKAMRDHLATELKAKQLKREADLDKNSLNSKRSQGKDAPGWEEDGGIFSMGGLVTTLYTF